MRDLEKRGIKNFRVSGRLPTRSFLTAKFLAFGIQECQILAVGFQMRDCTAGSPHELKLDFRLPTLGGRLFWLTAKCQMPNAKRAKVADCQMLADESQVLAREEEPAAQFGIWQPTANIWHS